MTTPMLEVELHRFDINTTQEELLMRVSSFNPYPRQAWHGIWVMRGGNPLEASHFTIKYAATGNMYKVCTLLDQPSPAVIVAPEIWEPKSNHPEIQASLDLSSWITLADWLSMFSSHFVRKWFDAKADYGLILPSVVVGYSKGLPVFQRPEQAFVNLVKLSQQCIEGGDLASGALLFDHATTSGHFYVEGVEYIDPAFALMMYTKHQLALDLIPVLETSRRVPGASDNNTLIRHTATRIKSLVGGSLLRQAVASTIASETSAARRFHFQRELERLDDELRQIQERLMETRTMGYRHLPVLRGMLEGLDIHLI